MAKTNTQTKATETTETKSAADLIKEHGGVSKAIRALANDPSFQKDGKVDKGAIAKTLGKRYQHVRNVLVTPLKG